MTDDIAALARVAARLADARAECNRCGGPFPEHAELCEYRTTAERADTLERERDEVRRKVEAYDAARAQVKREGRSRAEYVLRAEQARAEADRLRETLRYMADYKMTGTEQTLHIDFQGKARAALAGPQTKEQT